MSIIVKDKIKGDIILLTKGADSIIADRLKKEEKEGNEIFDKTFENLERYATNGLRTLLLAKRVLNEDFYNDWLKKYNVLKIFI